MSFANPDHDGLLRRQPRSMHPLAEVAVRLQRLAFERVTDLMC